MKALAFMAAVVATLDNLVSMEDMKPFFALFRQ